MNEKEFNQQLEILRKSNPPTYASLTEQAIAVNELVVKQAATILDLTEALEAWDKYAKECENTAGPDYGYRVTLKNIAAIKTEAALSRARGETR